MHKRISQALGKALCLPGVLMLPACSADGPPAAQGTPPPPAAHIPPAPISPAPKPSFAGEATTILSAPDAARLRNNRGVTLQWIDWDTRGTAVVTPSETGLWHLRAAQSEALGPGRLLLDGAILEIGEGYFTFRGTIRIADTPAHGRLCEQNKTWHFAVTQNRRYYRLREFEWCDDRTDYIDIYF